MSELFLPYLLAMLAKELGYTGNSFAEYRNTEIDNKPHIYLSFFQDWSPEDTEIYTQECLAPMYGQILNWLREEPRNIQLLEQPMSVTDKVPLYVVQKRSYTPGLPVPLDMAIEEALNLVKKTQKQTTNG